MRIRTTQLLVLLAVLAFAGCASGGGGQMPAGEALSVGPDQVAVEIRNNLLNPRVALTIRIRAPGRTVTTLGTVQSDRTQTFVVDSSNLAAGWVIIASRQGQELRVSRRLTTTGGSIVRWDLNADRLTTEDLPSQ
jgi:hypothetical protein